MTDAIGKTRREHLQDALEHARAMREEWLSKLKISPTDTYTKQKFHAYDKRVRWCEREIKRGKMMDWIPGAPRPSITRAASCHSTAIKSAVAAAKGEQQ